MINKWTCPHKNEANKPLILRTYKEDYETRATTYAKLCKACYDLYSKVSFSVPVKEGNA